MRLHVRSDSKTWIKVFPRFHLPTDRGLDEQPFACTVSIWLICYMFERRKWHDSKNKTVYAVKSLSVLFFGACSILDTTPIGQIPHGGGDFIAASVSCQMISEPFYKYNLSRRLQRAGTFLSRLHTV